MTSIEDGLAVISAMEMIRAERNNSTITENQLQEHLLMITKQRELTEKLIDQFQQEMKNG
jgi:hypothetical protein